MSDMVPQPSPLENATVGYCRACGKALDAATVRHAHGTIYCAEHVPLEETPRATASPYTQPAYTAPPPPLPHADVSPGLAFILGLIPGVGAIYNSQYSKALVHVIITGLLISIMANNFASGLEPLMGLLIAVFFFYMPFEAYHTARKRQLGQKVEEFSSLIPIRGSRFPAAPVLLIALGVLFLLNNLELFELRRALKYWPVLLIALGVYMLYLRLTADKEPGE